MKRVPEPELMDDPAQAAAYARADFAVVNQGFADGFVAAHPELREGRVLDVGCGPADIPIRIARARPGLRIVAADGSAAMLALATAACRRAGTESRIALVRACVPPLPFPERSFDAVVSNAFLHHLHDPSPFWRELARVLRPGGAIHVMDLFRPETEDRARAIVEAAAHDEDPILKRDFFASLLAAFTPEEVAAQLDESGLGRLECRVVSERHWLVSDVTPA
jgi:SAM-dependent methyltransferase